MDEPQTLLQILGKLPKTLYHYTSMSGLLGIVQSQRIWASHIRFLNDRTEQDHIWSLVEDRVAQRLAQIEAPEIKLNLERLQLAIKDRPDKDIYVACFSAEGDLLSQWLSYCPQGNGFAIGFGAKAMTINCVEQSRKMNDSVAAGAPVDMGKSGTIFPVLYQSALNNIPTYLDVIIDVCCGIRSLANVLPTFDDLDEPNRTYFKAFFASPNIGFLQLRFLEAMYKDASFSAERECRLVLRERPQELFFRPGKSMLIPYTQYPLELGGEYFIERVIVGPCPEPDLAVKSVKMLFESLGHTSVEVVKSSIPYRSW